MPGLKLGEKTHALITVSGDEELQGTLPTLDGLGLVKGDKDSIAPEADVPPGEV